MRSIDAVGRIAEDAAYSGRRGAFVADLEARSPLL